jgi:hypothetical protein
VGPLRAGPPRAQPHATRCSADPNACRKFRIKANHIRHRALGHAHARGKSRTCGPRLTDQFRPRQHTTEPSRRARRSRPRFPRAVLADGASALANFSQFVGPSPLPACSASTDSPITPSCTCSRRTRQWAWPSPSVRPRSAVDARRSPARRSLGRATYRSGSAGTGRRPRARQPDSVEWTRLGRRLRLRGMQSDARAHQPSRCHCPRIAWAHPPIELRVRLPEFPDRQRDHPLWRDVLFRRLALGDQPDYRPGNVPRSIARSGIVRLLPPADRP